MCRGGDLVSSARKMNEHVRAVLDHNGMVSKEVDISELGFCSACHKWAVKRPAATAQPAPKVQPAQGDSSCIPCVFIGLACRWMHPKAPIASTQHQPSKQPSALLRSPPQAQLWLITNGPSLALRPRCPRPSRSRLALRRAALHPNPHHRSDLGQTTWWP